MNRLLLFFSILIAVSSTSCISPKRLKYMQLREKALKQQALLDCLNLDSLIAAPLELQRPDYQVQVNDILSFQVRSLDPETERTWRSFIMYHLIA